MQAKDARFSIAIPEPARLDSSLLSYCQSGDGRTEAPCDCSAPTEPQARNGTEYGGLACPTRPNYEKGLALAHLHDKGCNLNSCLRDR